MQPDESGCWLWTAAKAGGRRYSESKYGQFQIGTSREKKSVRAHRYAYEHLIGPIPDGMEVDHLCRNGACVNPAHLETVSHRTNWERSMAPSRVFSLRDACGNGHTYTDKTVIPLKGGAKGCRICRVAATKAWRARRKAERDQLTAKTPFSPGA